jgi:hypothetical protein
MLAQMSASAGYGQASFLKSSGLLLASRSLGTEDFLPLGGVASEGIDGTDGIMVYSKADLVLEAGHEDNQNGYIYVEGGSGERTKLLNPDGTFGISGSTTYSTKVIKKNIHDIDERMIDRFIDTVSIKQFNYKSNNNLGISLIIEDEIEKQLPFHRELFIRENEKTIFKS